MKGHLKDLLSLVLVFSLALGAVLLLSGCEAEENDGKIRILCVLFPEYDWTKSVAGESESVEVDLLISNGTDMHSYQPTAADIIKISRCDLLIYGGGDASEWIEEALELAENKEVRTLDISCVEGVRLHEISSSSHEHEQDEHTSHEGHRHSTHDEHLWLSLKNAAVITDAIEEKLSLLDTANSEIYAKNAEAYKSKLSELDGSFKALADKTAEEKKFLLFADRFPFVYLLYDYGIAYRAPFEGCSTDTNADFATVASLIEEADKHACRYIVLTESGDVSLAKTVMSSSKRDDMEIVRLNSMQSVGKREIEGNISYLSVMEDNYKEIKKILSGDV